MNDIIKALAHPARREIIASLRERAHSAGELAERTGLNKPTLSGHLNVLKSVGLVSVERRSQTLIYRVNVSVLEDALANLMDMFRIGENFAADVTLKKWGKS